MFVLLLRLHVSGQHLQHGRGHSPVARVPDLVNMAEAVKLQVDWESPGVRVEWSDDEEPPPPKAKRSRPDRRPTRLFVCSADSLATTMLAARRSFEHVYMVPVDRDMRAQSRGCTLIEADDLVGAAEEIAHALGASGSAVIVAELDPRDRAPTLARAAARLVVLDGGRSTQNLPMPTGQAWASACRKFGSCSRLIVRGVLRELDAVRRRDAEEQKPMSALASAARAYNGREATSAQTELLRTAISDLTGSVGAVALERVGGTLLRFFLTNGDADLTPVQNTVDFAEG